MKVQLCRFVREKGGTWEMGIAFVEGYAADVQFIVDKDGKRLKNVWNYTHCQGPLSYIDSEGIR